MLKFINVLNAKRHNAINPFQVIKKINQNVKMKIVWKCLN